MVTDSYGRKFTKLRVSLTSQCNFSCLYCTGVDHEQKPENAASEHLSGASEKLIATIQKLHQHSHFESIRLTGGEPLLNPDVVMIVEAISKMGIDDIRLTTNGFLLPKFSHQLAKAGLKSVNVSLDAITPEVFVVMARRNGVQQVIKGIDKALEAGLKVKLNAVIMKNRNDKEIMPLLQFANNKGLIIRFLELMKMGPLHHTVHQWLMTQDDILQVIQKQHNTTPIPRKDGSTANYWQLDNGQVFGIIANESAPFCSDCNRLRLDASGKIYGCISNNNGIEVATIKSPLQITEALQKAMSQKQLLKFSGTELSMQAIGG